MVGGLYVLRASGKFAVSLKETENTSWEGSGREDQRETGMRVKAGRNRWSRADEPKKGDAGGREGARLKHKDKTGGRREGTEKAEGRR